MGIYIEDGKTFTKTVPAQPGIHSEAVVAYRPAVSSVRAEYQAAVAAGNLDRREKTENDLIAKYVVSVAGEAVTADQAARLVPNLKAAVLDLILGYAGSDEDAAAKKG